MGVWDLGKGFSVWGLGGFVWVIQKFRVIACNEQAGRSSASHDIEAPSLVP